MGEWKTRPEPGMTMKKNIAVTLGALWLWLIAGCYAHTPHGRVDVTAIPDRVYGVYVYSRHAHLYGVLLDIPDDEIRVFMRHTDRTEKVGLDRPGPYVEEFQRRIKGFHSAITIRDGEGRDRGYLMISRSLSYLIQPGQGGIMVSVWEPFTDDTIGPRLGPARRREPVRR
jgi:hypothetical protein